MPFWADTVFRVLASNYVCHIYAYSPPANFVKGLQNWVSPYFCLSICLDTLSYRQKFDNYLQVSKSIINQISFRYSPLKSLDKHFYKTSKCFNCQSRKTSNILLITHKLYKQVLTETSYLSMIRLPGQVKD